MNYLLRFIKKTQEANRLALFFEFLLIFISIPTFLFLYPTRLGIVFLLWLITFYAYLTLRKDQVSWKTLWHGETPSRKALKGMALCFLISLPLTILLTYALLPARLFVLPMQRPILWLIIIALYPLLSALPQELLFRSFFYRRYRKLFRKSFLLFLGSAISFSFVHIVFHNLIAPSFCLIGGLIFSYNYSQYKSLKWVFIEHAVYGCMIFTVGIGSYFVFGYKP